MCDFGAVGRVGDWGLVGRSGSGKLVSWWPVVHSVAVTTLVVEVEKCFRVSEVVNVSYVRSSKHLDL